MALEEELDRCSHGDLKHMVLRLIRQLDEQERRINEQAASIEEQAKRIAETRSLSERTAEELGQFKRAALEGLQGQQAENGSTRQGGTNGTAPRQSWAQGPSSAFGGKSR